MLPGQKFHFQDRILHLLRTANLPPEGRRTAPAGFSAQEIDLLARLVHAESAGEPYIGQVAVAATVLNRLESSLYPNTLSGVVNQVTNGYYQIARFLTAVLIYLLVRQPSMLFMMP